MNFVQNQSQQSYTVYGFAMCISAVVADNDGHAIELVQHTPKRDKGPVAQPEKVRLAPKPAHHHHMGLFGQADPPRSTWDQGCGPPQGSHATEHTFERIQFKQATANNGKRRAAQQYYHLVIELWADVGSQPQGNDQFIKIAYRKSAKMIVRGRSPGHYQPERRGSTGSGPGGSSGSLSYGTSQIVGSDYGTGSPMLPNYSSTYDTRPGGQYGGGGARHHHELGIDSVMSAEDHKSISETKEYQYFPALICEGSQDPIHAVDMFSPHQRSEHDRLPHMTNGLDLASKVKNESEGVLPSLFVPGPAFSARGCGRYDARSSSMGYYPTLPATAPAGLNMT